MKAKFNIDNIYKFLESDVSKLEKLEVITSFLQGNHLISENFIDLVNLGIDLQCKQSINHLKLHEYKCEYLHDSRKSEEGILFCEKFDIVLDKYTSQVIYRIRNEKYKLIFLFNLTRQQEAINIGENIIKKYSKSEDEKTIKELTDVYWRLGWMGTNFYPYKKCLEYLNKAIKLGEKFHQSKELLSAYASIGIIYKNNNDFENAIRYLKLALKITDTKTNLKSIMLCHIGNVLVQLKEFDEAKTYFDKAMEAIKVDYSPRSETLTLMGLAEYYILIDDLKSFRLIEMQISKIDYFQKDIYVKSDFYRLISEANYKTKKYDKALKFCEEFERMQENEKGLIELKKCFELKIKILKALEKYKDVVFYYEKLDKLNQEITNVSNQKALSEFEARFQNEKKEKEIQSLKLESTSFQLQSLRAQMNPHFVFNTIGSISSSLKPDSIDNSKKLLHSFARLMRSNLEFAELEKISLEEEITFLRDYLTLEKNRLGDKLDFQFYYDHNLDLDFIELPSMIIQPYIENAIKHGILHSKNKGLIEIYFQEEDDFLICKIKDNGIGRKASEALSKKFKKHLGKSTTINAKRLELINKKDTQQVAVHYNDLKDKNNKVSGTEVILKIQLT